MIFNLRQYISNETGVKVYANPRDIIENEKSVPDRFIQLIEEGGDTTAWSNFTTYQLQCICRDIDSPKARVLAYVVYHLLNDRFGLELPSKTVDGIFYASIKFAQISANSEPAFIGYDENGRAEYSNTYRFII